MLRNGRNKGVSSAASIFGEALMGQILVASDSERERRQRLLPDSDGILDLFR